MEAKQDNKGTRGRKPKTKKAEDEAKPENPSEAVEIPQPKREVRKTAAKSAPAKPAPAAVAGEDPSLEPPQKKLKTVSEGDHAVPDGGKGEVLSEPAPPAPMPKRKARAKKTEPAHEDTNTLPAQEMGDVSQALPKRKAAVRAKAAAKSTPKQKAAPKVSAKAKATPKSKAKAKARARGSGSSGSGGPQNRQFVNLEAPVPGLPDVRAVGDVPHDMHPLPSLAVNPGANPNPLNPGAQDPNGDLVDPDSFRSYAIKEILQCLRACNEVGTLNTKGKHEHQYEPLSYDLGERRWSVYWTRKAAGVKELRDKRWTELVYFSRQTPCCGTNLVLAKVWVRTSLVKCSMSFSLRPV